MKKLYIFALVATMFAACATDAVNEQSVKFEEPTPDTITVSFEGNDSRIQLNEEQKTVWTEGDLVSVFYRSNANQQWKFQGKTGDVEGELKRISSPLHTETLSKVVVVYPYNTNYYINPESCNIQAMLPAKQTYLKDSYGLNGNILVSSNEYNQFSLKNVCGWLKVQLTGTGDIEKITLRGNENEQVAGEIYINTTDGTSVLAANMGSASNGDGGSTGSTGGNLVFDDTVYNAVTLYCPDGVRLNEETATAFYIALPPQTFHSGISIEVMGTDGAVMTKSTSNEIVISRNYIQPMSAFKYEGSINMTTGLAYTTNDGYPIDPMTFDGFGVEFVDNMYDFSTGRGMLLFKDHVTTIPAEAFLGCNNMTWMRLPDSVKSIGKKAFYDCTSLEELTIPASVETIGELAFGGCTGVATINCNIEKATESSLGRFYRSKFKEVIIGERVTEIGDYAFEGCVELSKITLPSTLVTIGNYAFEGCTTMSEIIIPNKVTTLGEGAFKSCSNLVVATLGTAITSIGDSAFEECVQLAAITIPYYTSIIGSRAFYNCDALTSVTIPNQVTAVNNYTFYDCDKLESVSIGKRVKSIGDYAFNNCVKLTALSIGNSVTSIGKYAFYSCSLLATVTIPDSVTSIDCNAFHNCKVLKNIYCKPTTPPAIYYNNITSSDYSFPRNSGMKIYVPRNSYNDYMQYTDYYNGLRQENWYRYESYITPYDF